MPTGDVGILLRGRSNMGCLARRPVVRLDLMVTVWSHVLEQAQLITTTGPAPGTARRMGL